MRLIVTADDAGLSEAVDRGIAGAARAGTVTQTTFMVAAAFPDIASAAARIGGMNIPCGVHLQLTTGAPVSAALRDVVGERLPDHAGALRLDPELVRAEWRAQIEAAREAGLAPSHLDTHQGVHRLAAFRHVYFALARDFDLPVRGHDAAFAAEARAGGVAATRHVLTGWTGRRLGRAELLSELETYGGSGGILELVTHPGRVDARLEEMSAWRGRREAELAVLSDPDLRETLRARGIVLGDYGTLAT
ncbi:ChbG/HpnK family deacetylase [Roseicyclus sp. F158]|uniref:ChbG/HpnK family deacetylase n=1 Tax=Tropicimonas omnivorans TaxID=3075590 RepID=A0ABU3DL05_9RHOB|nr:ChbG/HpnK family deacetylase [Roseicyclus sp. F158]MDT0684399.1 ChbG/HpnK family deacetylase [Roseicyclus sp. F158]